MDNRSATEILNQEYGIDLSNEYVLIIIRIISANLNLDLSIGRPYEYLIEAIIEAGRPDFSFNGNSIIDQKKKELWLNKIEGYVIVKYLSYSGNCSAMQVADIKRKYYDKQMNLESSINAHYK